MPCCHDPVILKDKDWVGVEFFYDQALTYEKRACGNRTPCHKIQWL